ncbi:hypothetical protein VNO77_20797 [Canavalia gladiata]|uniref:Uncharacterized protein n=1 Tax=Canavalia gladiata TaxID=3824 RepID=A0AAN9LUZ3_CANGL
MIYYGDKKPRWIILYQCSVFCSSGWELLCGNLCTCNHPGIRTNITASSQHQQQKSKTTRTRKALSDILCEIIRRGTECPTLYTKLNKNPHFSKRKSKTLGDRLCLCPKRLA